MTPTPFLEFCRGIIAADRKGLVFAGIFMLLLGGGGGAYLYWEETQHMRPAPSASVNIGDRIRARVAQDMHSRSSARRSASRALGKASLGVLFGAGLLVYALLKRYPILELLENPTQIQSYQFVSLPNGGARLDITARDGKIHRLTLQNPDQIPYMDAEMKRLVHG